MRILLINAPYHFPDQTIHRSELLGIEYLSSSLRASGHSVDIYDPTFVSPEKSIDNSYYYGVSDEILTNRIKNSCPDLVGISCHYSFAAKESYKVARLAKAVNPNIITVIGGLFVSVYKQKALIECSDMDYALIGESELSFVDLLSNKPKEAVDGLVYRLADNILVNKKSNFVTNLDSLPFPDRDNVDITRYMNSCKDKKLYGLGYKPALSILTSRSCPYNCSFCNMWLVHGKKWRSRTVDNVISEIDLIVNKYKAQHMFVMDDNFTLDVNRAKSICEKIIQNGYKIRWNTPNGISVKKIDMELALLMKKSGCANVCVAIESGSEWIRNESINKRVSNDEITNAVSNLKQADIPVVGYVVVGMPEESIELFNESYKFIEQLPLTSIVVSCITPFPETELWHRLVKNNIISDTMELNMDNLNTPTFSTENFSKEDLLVRKQKMKDLFPGLGILEKIERANNGD